MAALLKASSLAVAALLGAGCSAAPPPPTPPAARMTEPPASDAPRPAAFEARWVETSSATVVGPGLPEGTLVLLGGRRALVASDGSVRVEETPSPEPLTDIVGVPTTSGTRVVGLGASVVYRFDSPLGRAAPFLRGQQRLGTWPGLLVVFPPGDEPPIALDIETGLPRPLPWLPTVRILNIAFKNMKEGAAMLEAVGLVVTRDGGASWQIASGTDQRDALLAGLVRWSGSSLRVLGGSSNEKYANQRASVLDAQGARFIPVGPAQHATSDPHLLRWIRSTGRDPLEAAALTGIEAPGGAALVASDGLTARVDLRTGAVLDLDTFDGISSDFRPPCWGARAGEAAWFLCPTPMPPDAGASLTRPDPYALFRLALGRPSVKLDEPRLRRNGYVEIRASSSGGVMLRSSCAGGFDGLACVRQPNGEWINMNPPPTPYFDWSTNGAGPLADGRVAIVGGHFGELFPMGRYDHTPEPPGAAQRPLRIDAIDASGKIERLAEKKLDARPHDLFVASPVVEGEDRALRFILRQRTDDEQALSVAVARPSTNAIRLVPIPGAKDALLPGRRGVAWSESSVMVSRDQGERWEELPMPPSIQRAMAKYGSVHVVVSDAGASFTSIHALLLGWGPPAPFPEPRPDLSASPPLAALPDAPRRPSKTLSCASLGPSPKPPPPIQPWHAHLLLASGPVRPGLRRDTNDSTFAILEREGPNKPDAELPVWRLRYQDPFAMGGGPRAWEGPAPKEVRGYPSLGQVAFSEREAVFTIRQSSATPALLLARVTPGGGPASVVEVPTVPGHHGPDELTLGPTPKDPVAWLMGTSLFVWRPGEPARAIASLGPSSRVTLDPPEAGSVTVRLEALTWVVPIPPLDPKGAPPARPTPESFVRSDPFELADLAPCAPTFQGARAVRPTSLRVAIDGAPYKVSSARYELRVKGSAACVAGLFVNVSLDAASGYPGADEPPFPYAFVRADLARRQAEGVFGLDKPSPLRRLRCELRP